MDFGYKLGPVKFVITDLMFVRYILAFYSGISNDWALVKLAFDLVAVNFTCFE